MFAGWRKIIVFRLAIVVSCIMCSPVMAKTLKNCGESVESRRDDFLYRGY
jgi:hypothetical protein